MNRGALAHIAAGLAALAALPVGPARGEVPPPQVAPSDMTVGAFYFPGWSQRERWHCVKASEQTLHPLLGYYREGDPEVADWHIKWALENGVSFFAFDYYLESGAEMLESALADGFLRSRYLDRFRFCLNWCNHAPAETQTREVLDSFGDVVIERYLKHPSYLRIEGKPVVIILSGYSFVKTLGVEGAREAFRALDERCRAAGLEGVYLVFCEGNITSAQAIEDSLAAGCRAFCLYNYPYAGSGLTGPGTRAELPYEQLLTEGPNLWKHWSGLTNGAFWPTAMAGWDRRPWTKDADLIRTGFTPELFGEALRLARESVNADRVAMIEAWNEWGEGSVLEPSVEEGFRCLRKVREVFCPDAPPLEGSDAIPDGLPLPRYGLELPSESRWAFDFGDEGWTASGCGPLSAGNGLLTAVSETADPQLLSSPTYLPCGGYRQLRLRMRLTPPPEEARRECVAQVFWSTVERQFRRETSVTLTASLDGRWREYVVDLTASAEWRGTMDRLRLDPTDAPGVRIELDRVEFVP